MDRSSPPRDLVLPARVFAKNAILSPGNGGECSTLWCRRGSLFTQTPWGGLTLLTPTGYMPPPPILPQRLCSPTPGNHRVGPYPVSNAGEGFRWWIRDNIPGPQKNIPFIPATERSDEVQNLRCPASILPGNGGEKRRERSPTSCGVPAVPWQGSPLQGRPRSGGPRPGG